MRLLTPWRAWVTVWVWRNHESVEAFGSKKMLSVIVPPLCGQDISEWVGDQKTRHGFYSQLCCWPAIWFGRMLCCFFFAIQFSPSFNGASTPKLIAFFKNLKIQGTSIAISLELWNNPMKDKSGCGGVANARLLTQQRWVYFSDRGFFQKLFVFWIFYRDIPDKDLPLSLCKSMGLIVFTPFQVWSTHPSDCFFSSCLGHSHPFVLGLCST